MRVLHINDIYGMAGGVEKYLTALLKEFRARGHWTGIVYGKAAGPLPSGEIAERFPTNFMQSLPGIVADLAEIVRHMQPDVVHVHGLGGADRIFGYLEPLHRLVPLVFYFHNHSLYCPGGMKFYPRSQEICRISSGTACLWHTFYHRCNSWRPPVIWKSMVRSIYAKRNAALADRILVASSYVKDCAIQNGFSKHSITILPYFTDLPSIDEYPDENQILFSGRIVRTKGLDLLLEALSYVREKFTLIVAGDGPDLERSQVLCRQLGLDDTVRFVGWCDPDSHAGNYRQASLLVVPSVWPEPFGMVGIEAMSYGKPVVAFNVGGIPEWLEDGATGFLVKPYDVKEMAEKINYLLEHPDVAHQMGMRGRTRVEQEFNRETHITRLLEIYKEVMDGRAQPSALAH